MEVIDTQTLAERLAGGDTYIRTKNGEVMGLAVTTRDNPEAPEVIVVGQGSRILANAQHLMACEKAVPVYLKQGVNAWAYRGEFQAKKFSKDPSVIEQYRCHRPAEKVAGILFMEMVDDIDEPQVGAGWSINPETRKAIEDAAVQRVWAHYEKDEYDIDDRQKDNCGYDLLVTKGKEMLRVEVKGTASAEQAFWLTRNERAASVHTAWRLAVVTNALSDAPSKPTIYTAAQMEAKFDLEPYVWRAKLKS